MIKIISIDVVDNFNSSDRDILLEKCKKLERDKDSMLNDCIEFYNRVSLENALHIYEQYCRYLRERVDIMLDIKSGLVHG